MKTREAFTLVEILVVVALLAIIAVVALPKFSNASAAARASMLADNVRILRSQITVFKGQHCGVPPGYPNCDVTQTPTEQAFVLHMTMASTAGGATALPGTDGYRFGPYLRETPTNPVNGLKTVQIIGDSENLPEAADDSHGWVYKPATITFRADSSGADESGGQYIDY